MRLSVTDYELMTSFSLKQASSGSVFRTSKWDTTQIKTSRTECLSLHFMILLEFE